MKSEEKVIVTFGVLTYNQEDYVRAAIEGAFSQNYSPLEIIITDDCSSDETFRIIEEMVECYKGPHTVKHLRNNNNIGIARQINKINNAANGELIVVAAGDDISMPDRVSKIVEAYILSHKSANYIFSLAQEIGIDGGKMNVINSPGAKNFNNKLLAAVSPYPVAIGATQAWSKYLVHSFPPLHASVWAEDQVLGVRGLLLGSVCCIDDPLVHYRVGCGISTRKKKFTFKKYYQVKLAIIQIYIQRLVDSLHVGNYPISMVVSLKILLLVIVLPISPLISIFRNFVIRKISTN